MIRPARMDDLPDLVILGESLFSQTIWAAHVDFELESFRATLMALLEADTLLVAVDNTGSVVGMLGFVVAPIYANRAQCFAQEIFVIAKPTAPGAGRLLIAAYEQEARAMGAIVTLTSAQVGLRDKALGRVFNRLGYVETERTYMKVL